MFGREASSRRFIGLIAILFWALHSPGNAADRIALIVGNANYPDADAPLSHAMKNARALAEEMRRHGFEVVLEENLTKNGMRRAIDTFKSKIRPSSTSLFFFSGFGVQSNRQSYLIPIDAQIWTELDVRRDGLNLEAILAELGERSAGARIVIIDASRRNPFERRFRGVSAGLAPVVVPSGSLVVYAAAPGQVVHDRDGDNSLFVDELLKEARTLGPTIEEMLNRARISVSRASNGQQLPWLSSSLIESRRFDREGGATPERAIAIVAPQAAESTAKPGPAAAPMPAEVSPAPRAESGAAMPRPIEPSVPVGSPQVPPVRPTDPQPASPKVSAPLAPIPTPPAAATESRVATTSSTPAANAAPRPAEKPAAPATPAASPGTTIAAVQPSAAQASPGPVPPSVTLRDTDLVKLLHFELRRVGCLSDPIEEEWTGRSRRALEQFNRYSGMRNTMTVASTDALMAVREKSGRVCPLVCVPGSRADGNRCVAIVCKAGYELSREGTCEKQRARVRTAVRSRDVEPARRPGQTTQPGAARERSPSSTTAAVFCGRGGCQNGTWQTTRGPNCRRVFGNRDKYFCQ